MTVLMLLFGVLFFFMYNTVYVCMYVCMYYYYYYNYYSFKPASYNQTPPGLYIHHTVLHTLIGLYNIEFSVQFMEVATCIPEKKEKSWALRFWVLYGVPLGAKSSNIYFTKKNVCHEDV